MDTNEDPFPHQLSEAAEKFPNYSTAYAQLYHDADYVGLHIQAPEIMMQFAGHIQYGKDPKGILFYDSYVKISLAYFTVFYYKGPGNLQIVRVDFYASHGYYRLRPFARFLARVDTEKYVLPPVRPGLGQGNWRRFKAATSVADAIRQEDSTRFYLQLPPIGKEVYFETSRTSSINAEGIFMFQNLMMLKDKPLHVDWPLVADYSPDRIIFYLRLDDDGEKLKEIALFLPANPLKDIGSEPDSGVFPKTMWRDFEPDSLTSNSQAPEAA